MKQKRDSSQKNSRHAATLPQQGNAKFHYRAKKSLGQNFLNSAQVAKDIVRVGVASPEEIVLEIGPGKGILTRELLLQAKRIYAIEKDERMVALLQEKFAKEIVEGKLELISGDILDFNPSDIGLVSGKYTIVANIPYYITGEILRKFLSCSCQPKTMLLMLQKEVAERIVTRNNKESILSLSVKVYGNPRIVKSIPACFFTPAPKVDSAILAIEDISKKHFSDKQEENLFFAIVKAAFAHKRKLALRNLETVFSKEDIREIFTTCEIDQKVRAEDIPLSKWLCITKTKEGY